MHESTPRSTSQYVTAEGCPVLFRRRHSSANPMIVLLALAVLGFLWIAHLSWYRSPEELAHFRFSTGKTLLSGPTVDADKPVVRQTAGILLPQLEFAAPVWIEDELLHHSPRVARLPQDRAPPRFLA